MPVPPLPASRASGLALGFALTFVLTSGARLQAAFTLGGNLPASFANMSAIVSRESLEERDSKTLVTETVANGRLNVRIDSGPGLFTVQIGDATASFVAADGQSLQLTGADDGKSLRVTGSTDQELFAAYETFRADSLARKVLPARQAAAVATDPSEITRLTEREVAGYTEHRRELNDFTLAKLRGSAALYAASLRWDGDHRLDDLAAAVRDYTGQFPNTEIGRLMTARIARFRATAIGGEAPALAGAAPDGTRTALADLRGRYVLVDFWASWCAPCRLENRNYVELYRRYHPAGFEILAVSVDQAAAAPAWKSAIAKDEATWRHISDLTGWKSPLAAAYNVTALPASFLLDPAGRIVAKDLRGKALADRLESLLGSARKAP